MRRECEEYLTRIYISITEARRYIFWTYEVLVYQSMLGIFSACHPYAESRPRSSVDEAGGPRRISLA
jgi:hypothetical protein